MKTKKQTKRARRIYEKACLADARRAAAIAALIAVVVVAIAILAV